MKNNQVFVYGEIAIDNIIRVPHAVDREKNTFVLEDIYLIGGMASNVAALLALWEIPVAVLGYPLGDDEYGRKLTAMLKKFPYLDLEFLPVVSGIQTGLCRIIVPPNGDRYILAYNSVEREAQLTPVKADMLAGASHFVVDCLAVKEPYLSAAKLAHDEGLCVVASDVNTLDSMLIPYADVICNSAGLLNNLNGISDPLPFSRELHQLNKAVVITTDGPRAVHVIDVDGSEFWALPAKLDDAQVVDTTGAGDALKAGVTYGLIKGLPLRDVVRYGMGTGSLIIQAIGAVAREPSVAEVLACAQMVHVSDSPIK
jgi:sugar/nucleoside kinase (ribokinase family)